jgi:hypothetical protein
MTTALCAVLLNPPTTSGSRTAGAVARAAELLGYTDFTLTNLISLNTHSSGQLAAAARDEDWQRARPQLQKAVKTADALLFGWGLLSQLGSARPAARQQVLWLVEQARAAGHSQAWAVGDARHPSRWHQYTADRHGRTPGGSPEERLAAVLVSRPLDPTAEWLGRSHSCPHRESTVRQIIERCESSGTTHAHGAATPAIPS